MRSVNTHVPSIEEQRVIDRGRRAASGNPIRSASATGVRRLDAWTGRRLGRFLVEVERRLRHPRLRRGMRRCGVSGARRTVSGAASPAR